MGFFALKQETPNNALVRTTREKAFGSYQVLHKRVTCEGPFPLRPHSAGVLCHQQNLKRFSKMEPKDAIMALETIIEASVSDIEKQREIKANLHKVYNSRNVIATKGILADCHKFGDKKLSEEIKELIKDVFFYFG